MRHAKRTRNALYGSCDAKATAYFINYIHIILGTLSSHNHAFNMHIKTIIEVRRNIREIAQRVSTWIRVTDHYIFDVNNEIPCG